MSIDNLKSKSIKAFLWDFFGKLATQGAGFVISIFLARLLDPADFGLMAIVTVIIGVAGVFTDVGLGSALIQRRKTLPIHYASVFYFNIFIGFILTFVTYFSAELIADFYKNNELILLVQIMSLSFVINSFSSVQTTKLRKELNYAALTRASFLASLASGILGVFLAFRYDAGVWSLVIQALAMGIFYNLLVWSLSQWKPSLQFSFKALTQLWEFGFRIFLSGLLDAIFSRLDFLIIGKLFPATTLGFFQRAKTLNAMVIQYSSGSLMTVLFPVLSQIQNDLSRFQHIVVKALGIICFVVFLLLGGLYLVSEELIKILFGEKWLPSVEYFQVLLLSGFAYPVSALLVNILSSRGNSKAFLHLEIYKKTLLATSFFVLYQWDIKIYLYYLILTSILGVLLNIIFAAREIKLPFHKLIKPILTQAIISISITITTLHFVLYWEINELLVFFFKGLFFIFSYVLVSGVFKTSSYIAFAEQIKQRI